MSALDCDLCGDAVKSLSQIRGMDIGKALQKRIKTGKIDEDSIKRYELDWDDRLRCLDGKHTDEKKLTMREVEKLMEPLEAYAATAPPPACQYYKQQLLECLQKHKQENLICNDIVVQFKGCVDDMMYEVSRKDQALPKKPTYKQQFDNLLI